MILCLAVSSFGAIIDFAGGTAYLFDGTSVVTDNTGLWNSIVDYYEEDGMRVDFVGGYGTIGDYYSTGFGTGGGPAYENSVIHAHPFTDIDIVFSKIDGTPFDLTYVDMTSNTDYGGGGASGNELSYITTGGYSMLLPSSDWGLDYTYFGDPGDGIKRLWLDANFKGITSFTLSSLNAYCFGMDNFYIDQEAPPPIPAPAAIMLGMMGTGLVGWLRRRRSL